ncbi:hypothetical protein [Arthrobacter sp. Y81]|uniref:hypothetical protein n=1 Tax=Arthrobacter sp. Y81 TaxID=2058897 RepID=UPI0021588338|nr:hypothetical protein [Arthrobacter sp. Y81]
MRPPGEATPTLFQYAEGAGVHLFLAQCLLGFVRRHHHQLHLLDVLEEAQVLGEFGQGHVVG